MPVPGPHPAENPTYLTAVRALKLDPDGTLWIGTYDSGLGRFKDGKFTRYSTKDELFDNGAFQILEDDFGWFWMSCNRGLFRVRRQELEDFAADAAARPSGFGLAGIADRVRMLGSEWRIDSQEGQGTRVMVRLALPAAIEEKRNGR